jgi:hypothetical protein
MSETRDGTFACPICGRDTPHAHDEETVYEWQHQPDRVRGRIALSDPALFEAEMEGRFNHRPFAAQYRPAAGVIGAFRLSGDEWRYAEPTVAACWSLWRAATQTALDVLHPAASPGAGAPARRRGVWT